jgi:CheY-like chemotaxis protein
VNHKALLLVVDNLSDQCDTVREFLERESFSVITATSAVDAKREMATKKIDVAIIDLRLERDWDEHDFSGVTLAKELPPSIPKIIWTGYPTVEAVRRALGPTLDGLSAAVGFVSKLDDEGLPALLKTIRLALTPIDAPLTRKLLKAFDAEAPVALQNRFQEVGPEVASERMYGLLSDMAHELERRRERESGETIRLRRNGTAVGWVGTVAIVATLPLLWYGETTAALLSAAVTALTNVVHQLFSRREKAALERLTRSYMELEKVYRATHLFALVQDLESKTARDAYRKKLLDHLIDRGWLFDNAED